MNKVLLMGRLGADVEMRYTPGGTEVATFSIATSERWTDKEGNKKEDTQWHRIVAWRNLAKICGEYLGKGDLILLEGKLKQRSYEKDGQKVYVTEVHAVNIEFANTSKKGGGKKESGSAPDAGDEDIPF